MNSINHQVYINYNEDDTIRSAAVQIACSLTITQLLNNPLPFHNSNKSYGSHKNRSFKDESHKGSLDSLDDGEEKKDASKEDLEDGTRSFHL